MPGIEDLNKAIERFEKAQKDLREEVRLAHEATKGLKEQRRLAEAFVHDTFLEIERIIREEVKKQLDGMGKEVETFTGQLYERVGLEIDKLISAMLGKSPGTGRDSDHRYFMVEHLKQYLKDQINVDFSDMPKIVKD